MGGSTRTIAVEELCSVVSGLPIQPLKTDLLTIAFRSQLGKDVYGECTQSSRYSNSVSDPWPHM
jgi:hypothetical protein